MSNAVFILANYRRSYRVDPATGTVERLYDFPLDDEWWTLPADTPEPLLNSARTLLKKHLKALDDARAQEERL